MITRVGRLAIEFDGIDTVSNITLNGVALGMTANQHRSFRFDVSTIMRNTGNTLVVELMPATVFATAAAAAYPYDIGDETFIPQHLQHRAFIRKQQSDFGWVRVLAFDYFYNYNHCIFLLSNLQFLLFFVFVYS